MSKITKAVLPRRRCPMSKNDVAILADLHFGARNNNPFILANQRRFFDRVFFPYLRENSIETIFILGDVFDQRRSVNVGVMDEVADFFFTKLKDFNVNVLIGNHDTFFKDTNRVNTVEHIMRQHVPSMTLAVDEPVEVTVGNCQISMVPWITGENWGVIAEHIKTTNSNMVFGHFEINGFEMTKGNFCDHGLQQSLFKRFDLVLSGHFHLRSNLGQIHYVGTPVQMDWNDFGSSKGFAVLDCNTKKLSYVNNPKQDFVKVDFPLANPDDADEDYSGCFVKISCSHGFKRTELDKFVEKVTSCNPADVQVSEKPVLVSIDENVATEIESMETSAAIEATMSALETTDDVRAKLTTLLNEIYAEAMSQ